MQCSSPVLLFLILFVFWDRLWTVGVKELPSVQLETASNKQPTLKLAVF